MRQHLPLIALTALADSALHSAFFSDSGENGIRVDEILKLGRTL